MHVCACCARVCARARAFRSCVFVVRPAGLSPSPDRLFCRRDLALPRQYGVPGDVPLPLFPERSEMSASILSAYIWSFMAILSMSLLNLSMPFLAWVFTI